MAAVRIDINPTILRWAREAMNVDRASLARAVGVKEQRIDDWESAAAAPTIRQLDKVAKKLLRDPAFFVGDDVPAEEPALASFRRVFNAPQAGPSPELLREVAVARARRDDLLEIWSDSRAPAPEFGLRLLRAPGHQAAAQTIRDWAGVTFEQQLDANSPYSHFRLWVDAVESQNVLVFHASRIPVAEFRGLAIHLNPAPIVLLNGGDSVSARVFTLLHEVCHLALGENDWSQNGLSAAVDVGADDSTEAFCNRVAAELLAPVGPLSDCARDLSPLTSRRISEIANVFNVNRQRLQC